MKRLARLPLLLAAASMAGTLHAGTTFTAKTKAESPTARLVWIADSTVQGSIDGERGRIDVVESKNKAMPKGSVILTTDGGKTARLFDPAVNECRAWAPVGGANVFRPAAPGTGTSYQNVRVAKLADEEAPAIAGQATRHLRFSTSYETSVKTTGSVRRSKTERTDDVWVAAKLTDPALALWLAARPGPTGIPEIDAKVSGAMGDIAGAALKHVSVTKLTTEGRPAESMTTTVEVTALSLESVAGTKFADPFPCKMRKPEDRR